MTTTDTTSKPISLEQALEGFLRALEGKNRSEHTIAAYRSDLSQFLAWLAENNAAAAFAHQVGRADVTEFLSTLARARVSGVTRARKLAAIRELFRHLHEHELIERSPTLGIETPKKERNARAYLQPDEYRAMLALAGGNPRDYAVLTVFLQTGLRVSELCALECGDIDLDARVLRVRSGKGMQAREIELEKKGIQAIKSWLAVRPRVAGDALFLNQYGQPIGTRGVKKLVTKYRRAAGITKKAGCHSLRHTFATIKAQKNVSPWRLKEWLGHQRLDTTQIYVHLARQSARKEMEATSL